MTGAWVATGGICLSGCWRGVIFRMEAVFLVVWLIFVSGGTVSGDWGLAGYDQGLRWVWVAV